LTGLFGKGEGRKKRKDDRQGKTGPAFYELARRGERKKKPATAPIMSLGKILWHSLQQSLFINVKKGGEEKKKGLNAVVSASDGRAQAGIIAHSIHKLNRRPLEKEKREKGGKEGMAGPDFWLLFSGVLSCHLPLSQFRYG